MCGIATDLPTLGKVGGFAYVVASANVQEKQSQAVSAVFADKGNVPDLGWQCDGHSLSICHVSHTRQTVLTSTIRSGRGEYTLGGGNNCPLPRQV